jgi:hypothetical protein
MRETIAADVDALVAYDEQLRQGIEIVVTDSSLDNSRALPAGLAECLRLIEQHWPRSGHSSTGRHHLPARIGRFEIKKVLGQGGFGIVYLAHDPILGRQVALKAPRLHVLANEGLRERFRREGRATAALDHPNIVPIHELGEAGPLCYIASAYCEGPSLAQWLTEQTSKVAPHTAARILKQLAEAMHYSHQRGVLHRDLKPNNVLLFPTPGRQEGAADPLPFVPRIVDFGLASLTEEGLEATGTSAVIGTPLYMAPEQALPQSKEIGPAADVYALGVMLYEVLAGQPPFTGSAPLEVLDQVRNAEPPPLRQHRPDAPRDLETICLRCLQKRPEDRYASTGELADDLQRFLDGREINARPVSIWQRAVRVCEQQQRIREAGLTVIAVHAAVVVSMLLTLCMIHAGNVIERPAGFSLTGWSLPPLFSMASFHVPMIYVGWMLMERRTWAAWFSMVAGLVLALGALLFIVGIVPAGMTDWDEIPGFRIFYPMMAVLLAVQTAMSGVALMALRRLPKG